MKKILLLLLVFSMILPLHCSATGNPAYDYIIFLLEAGEYDMAIHVIEGMKMYGHDGQAYVQPTESVGPEEIIFELVPETNDTDWFFNMDLINTTRQGIQLERLQIVDRANDSEFGRHEFAGADLARLGLDGLYLQPNEGQGWNDAHPIVPDFHQRDYIFYFRNDQGNDVVMVFAYSMHDAVPAQQPTGDWQFPAFLENTGNSPITLVAMDITDLMDGQPLGTVIFEGEDMLASIGLGGLTLQPGESYNWCDGHPFTDAFNGREYRFHFRDANGETVSQVFRFENLDQQSQAIDYSADVGRNLRTLRHDAQFEVEVAPGVFWVPASILGGSSFSNMDIYAMLGASPEEKQEAISTLYEALQLYQVGNFTASDDNMRIMENGVNWEHHKPGYHAVRTNTGCCATDSNWLRYILDGDYDEIGFIATSQRDGSGHVYNYILQDEWYYFIDLTHYRADGGAFDTAVEDGNPAGYHATDFILGNIHRTQSIQAYVDYVQQAFNDPPGMMFMYTAENVLAVDGARSESGVQIIYEDAGGLPIQVIFDDPNDALEYIRAASPVNLPDWNQHPSGF